MKQLMILGGLTGFLIGIGFGWLNQSTWPNVIWRALAVTYAAALLMRWWGQIWVNSLREVHLPASPSVTPDGSSHSQTSQPSPAK